jgi:hypothetical protein
MDTKFHADKIQVFRISARVVHAWTFLAADIRWNPAEVFRLGYQAADASRQPAPARE